LTATATAFATETAIAPSTAAPDSTRYAISTSNLSKSFGNRVAVRDITLDLPMGRVIGFVGPNGSGKTTTIRMLLGLIRPTSGTARVLGESISDPATYLHRVGALIETPAFYPTLSGWDNLRVLTSLGNLDKDRVPELLHTVGLSGREGDKVGSYSLGMKQRLGVAAALLPDPDLLVLDEPANGLDPEGIIEMRELMRSLRERGKTLFVSSHLLGELEQIADWLVMIRTGELVYTGPTSDLTSRQSSGFVIATSTAANLQPLKLLTERMGFSASLNGDHLRVTAPPEAAGRVNEEAMKEGITLTEIRPVQPTLEQTFLDMISGDLNA
jgi:ABC-2 type transport system ATP-binding protein